MEPIRGHVSHDLSSLGLLLLLEHRRRIIIVVIVIIIITSSSSSSSSSIGMSRRSSSSISITIVISSIGHIQSQSTRCLPWTRSTSVFGCTELVVGMTLRYRASDRAECRRR